MNQRIWATVMLAVVGLPLQNVAAEDVVVGQGQIVLKNGQDQAVPAGVVVVEGAAGQGQIQIQVNQIPLQPRAAARAAPQPAAEAAKAGAAVDADPQVAARARQRQEQAKQFEGLLQPMLRAELELVRRTCGSLVPEARRQVLAAGRAEVKEIAETLATRQMNGQMGRLDARQQLRDAVRDAAKPHAAATELAAYDREETLRDERRAHVARVQIIAKVDDELELTDVQRKAIEEHLVRSWNAEWIRELDDTGNMINNRRLAPDYAEVAIVPHLDPGQRDEWKAWCQVAGSRFLGNWQNWQWYSLGLTQSDPWWGP